ncbi:MAG: hypothetical protein LBS19_16705, partial [Clostridiales bacterium]|nr:hypothetical protein [Clostridiales bacterium]
ELPEIAAKSIITVDRGYPSADMFEKFQESKLSFAGRCKNGFSKTADDAPLGDSTLTLKNGLNLKSHL